MIQTSTLTHTCSDHPLSGAETGDGVGARLVHSLQGKRSWVYIVRCGDNSLYVGATTHIIKRISQHWGLESYTTTRRGGIREVIEVIPCYSMWHALTLERALQKKYVYTEQYCCYIQPTEIGYLSVLKEAGVKMVVKESSYHG